MFQTTSYKDLFHTWQNSENMKTSLCIVLSPARASPLDYFQHLLVSHTLIHTHVFCYHEADISLVERNVSTTIRQIAQLWICEFRICGITLSPSCCVFSSRQWCTSPLLSGMISSLFYRNTEQRLLWKTVENAPNESHYKDAVNFEQQQSALFFPCVAEVNVTPWASAGCWLNLIWWIFALYVYKCGLSALGLNKRISYKSNINQSSARGLQACLKRRAAGFHNNTSFSSERVQTANTKCDFPAFWLEGISTYL